MDNKSSPQGDLPPPPYTPRSDSTIIHHQSHLGFLTYNLQHHLASLSDRIRSARQVQAAQQSLNDSSLLSHIVPLIEDFIADLGSQHTLPLVATLTLVPGTAVPENATLSGLEEMKRRGEVCLVSRVEFNQKDKDLPKSASMPTGGSEQLWTTGQEFSDWGRFGSSGVPTGKSRPDREMLWWRDEGMARRLAGILHPKIEPSALVESTAPVTAAVEQTGSSQMEKRIWNWPSRKNNRRLETSKNNPDIYKDSLAKTENLRENDLRRSQMSVEAQEVAFRQENEFGIIESHNGWALVVVVTIRA